MTLPELFSASRRLGKKGDRTMENGKRDGEEGLRLLKKRGNGFFRLIFSRLGLFVFLVALQLFALFSIFRWFAGVLPYILGGTTL